MLLQSQRYIVCYWLMFFWLFEFQDTSAWLTHFAHHFHDKTTKHSYSSMQLSVSVDGYSFSTTTKSSFVYQSQVLGDIRRIRIPGEESFLGAMGVPTFASTTTTSTGDAPLQLTKIDKGDGNKAWGLEGALDGLGPSLFVPNVLDAVACETLIDELEQIGFGNYEQGKNTHGAMQIVVSPDVAQSVALALSPHIDVGQVEALRTEMLAASGKVDPHPDVRLNFVGLNRRWRIYRYNNSGNETFAPHIDASFPPSGLSEDGQFLEWNIGNSNDDEIISRLTVLMYLNEDFHGGETNFYRPINDLLHPDDPPSILASVRPRVGGVLLFPQGVGEEEVEYARQHWPLHEGSPVLSGSNRPKYVIRSDALFVTQRVTEGLMDVDDSSQDMARLSQYDNEVRATFIPQSDALSPIFLNHVASLYNPHMGAENLGPLLYSFLRFTKQRQIVEIGAGYTSLWILQALDDNDLERNRISKLEQEEKCRLLDIEWTVPQEDNRPSSLLCIDNCLHQKETATGALAVAQTLGLDSYLHFQKGDAFDELSRLAPESVDVLWCDFGVGARIRDFVAGGAWKSIRPGGFLICHSTLTNLNTRNWLEQVRTHAPQEDTGMDPNEYSELSLLEPHKRYQNSVTILQKRKDYAEPVYSQYA